MRVQAESGQQPHYILSGMTLKDSYKKKNGCNLPAKKDRTFGNGPGHSLCKEGKVKYIWNHSSGKWAGQLVRSLERKRRDN